RPGPPGNVTRAANKVAARPRRESRTTGSTGTSRKIATVERREASVSFFTGNAGVSNKTPRAGHGAQIRVPRRHSCARRRSPPPRGVEKEMMFGDVPKEKGEEEDEVGDRETNRTKIAGWVERRGPARARAKPENNNHRAAGPGVSPRSTQPTALRYGG